MFQKKIRKLSLGVFGLFLSLVACRPINSITGQYEGALSLSSKGVIPVSTKIETIDNESKLVTVSEVDGKTLYHMKFTFVGHAAHSPGQSQERLSLNIEEISFSNILLKRHGHCFESDIARLCLQDNGRVQFILGRPQGPNQLSLLVDPANEIPSGPPASRADITLDDLMRRTLRMNFELRIQAEHVFQARHMAKRAYGRLFPSLSWVSLPTLILPSTLGLLSAIGDFLPFVLPSRWFEARAAAKISQAEAHGLEALKADALLQVQILAFLYERDLAAAGALERIQKDAEPLGKLLQERLSRNEITKSVLNDLESVFNFLAQDQITFATSAKEQRIAMSQALGGDDSGPHSELINWQIYPLPDSEIPEGFDGGNVFDRQRILDKALARSFELRQLEALTQASSSITRAMPLSVLDPSNDFNDGMGLGLIHQIYISKSRTRELELKKEQFRNILRQKVDVAVVECQHALKLFQLARQSLEVQKQRVEHLWDLARRGSSEDVSGQFASISDTARAYVAYESAKASYLTCQARLDRFSLRTYYRLSMP